MTKLVGITAVLVVVTCAVAIGSIVLNIVILSKVNDIKKNEAPAPNNSPMTTTTMLPPSSRPTCNGTVNANYKGVGDFLKQGLDESFDPCDNFYMFTCNKYLQKHQADLKHVPRVGTYDEGQTAVNLMIYNTLGGGKDTNLKTATEKITKKIVDACVANTNNLANNKIEDKAAQIYGDLKTMFTSVPFLDGAANTISQSQLFTAIGQIEQQHALGTLMSTLVSVDYKTITRNAMYIGQPPLAMPRDFYVKPQFLEDIEGRVKDVKQLLALFAKDTNSPAGDLQKAAEDIVNFEVSIAMASWPDDLLRNYNQQYNQYTVAQLEAAYPNIGFGQYVTELLRDNGQNDTDKSANSIILTQPSYFTWLDSVFEGKIVDQSIIINYLAFQVIADNNDFLAGAYSETARKMNYVPFAMRRGMGIRKINARKFVRKTDEAFDNCVDMVTNFMPYGPGYIYVKSRKDKYTIQADVKTQTELVIGNFIGNMVKSLTWMTQASHDKAVDKSQKLWKNYGWPSWFGNFTQKDDDFVDGYNKNYADILKTDDYYEMLKIMKTGMEKTEFFAIMAQSGKPGDTFLRENFLASPATVNAWYQPERNSITFPFAVFSHPYYDFAYPQAFNYGGQGGTGGHELTHGYDDEGVQFGPEGMLSDCGTFHCGWMDSNSTKGFTDMAQCVVSQFNTQCCPVKEGNVHCANGATTQGENIADLGGQQAAHKAYREWVQKFHKGVEEDCVPGMETYTPNQIFWITYGYSWCMAQTTPSIVNQILTNPHAPAQCRTNQVMQDIPDFGIDFGCPRGSNMYPQESGRCKVWVGV